MDRTMFDEMFGRHHLRDERCFARGRDHRGGPEEWFGPFGGRRGHGPRGGFGPGRERLFESGDVKLVILRLLAEQPSYGYQLIKTMEERLAGGYTPSAGIIYPTLTMLEEEGLASSATENGKKVYSVTAEGLRFLEENSARVEELFERLREASQTFERGRSPELMRAFHNLRSAIGARMIRGNLTPEQMRKIADAINAAAKTIDEI